jgi:hypothetical protein
MESISLINPDFGEQKAQSCENAWLQQLARYSSIFYRPCWRWGSPRWNNTLEATRKRRLNGSAISYGLLRVDQLLGKAALTDSR